MMKNKKTDQPTPKISGTMWWIFSSFSFVLLMLFVFSLQRLFSLFPSFVETVYSTKIFRFLSFPVSFISSLFPFSLTEIALFMSGPALILLVVLFILQMVRSKDRRHAVVKDIKRVGWTLSILYLVFMLMLGFNYARLPINTTIGIETLPRAKEDLLAVCRILLDGTNAARLESKEVDGVMVLRNGIPHALETAYKGFDAVSSVYPVLQGPPRRAKGVMVSGIWSYTGITGMFFPFFVEANVNIDSPPLFLPNTILHELAHTRGIAREDEAGFVAFLTGIHHPDNDFRYSSFLSAYIQTSNALYSVDKAAYADLNKDLSDAVKRDLDANSAYWKKFEGPVQDVSTSVNNAYLQSNMQVDGVQSYGRSVDLILGYYLS